MHDLQIYRDLNQADIATGATNGRACWLELRGSPHLRCSLDTQIQPDTQRAQRLIGGVDLHAMAWVENATYANGPPSGEPLGEFAESA